jgi:hypothetical protein
MAKEEILQLLEGALGHLDALAQAFKDPEIKKRLGERIKKLTSELDQSMKMAKQVLALEKRAAKPETGVISPGDLAKQFRLVVENLHQEAQNSQGDAAVILKSMDIEVKGLIMAREGKPAIMTATPEKPLDPGDVSTIRMSFGTVPFMTAAPEEPKKRGK